MTREAAFHDKARREVQHQHGDDAMKHDFLEHKPGHVVKLTLLNNDWLLPLTLTVQLLDFHVEPLRGVWEGAPVDKQPHFWWEFRLMRGYRLLCELRTYNHRFAVPLLIEILKDEFRDGEEQRTALVALHEIFGNARALEDLRGGGR